MNTKSICREEDIIEGYKVFSTYSNLMMSILRPLNALEINSLLNHFPQG